ncbi:MAG TPA: ATP-binding cassette domain-containing protein [Capillibacterium sp.]
MLQVKGLSQRYAMVHVLKGVTFTLPSGAIVGLIGPNGAGKTTLLQWILRLVRPEEGENLPWRTAAGRQKKTGGAKEMSYL